MKKRSALSNKMIGILATAMTVTPVVAVHATPAVTEEAPTIDYFIEKGGPATIIDLPSLFPSAAFNNFNVSGAVYGHSTYTIDGNNNLIITPRSTIPLSKNHDLNIDTIGFGVDGIEHKFNVQVVSKPVLVQPLPDLIMIHNHTATIDLAHYFSDEDDNANLQYYISGSLMSGYTCVSGTELSIYAGSQAFTNSTISVTASDSSDLEGHSVTNTFQLTVAANRPPVVGTAFNENTTTIDAEVNDTGLHIPKSEFFTDLDGDTMYYTFSGEYGCALYVNVSGDTVDIYANQPGQYYVSMTADDNHQGVNTLGFTVNVHPKLSFNSTGSTLYFNGANVSVRSSTVGTVYLVPTTETILSSAQLENLVTDHKASSSPVTSPASDNLIQTAGLPMGTYRLILSNGQTFYSPVIQDTIYVASSNFLNGLASADGKIDVGSVLKFLNGSNVAQLKQLGLIDRNVIHSLLDRITPIVEPQTP